MNRKLEELTGRQLLNTLQRLWDREGRLNMPLDVMDLLDDLAFLGLKGMSSLYITSLRRRRIKNKSLDKNLTSV